MNKPFVRVIAGGAGLVVVACAALLAYALDSVVDATIEPPARALDRTRLRRAADEPGILFLPTITVVGEPPRRGAAELQRPDTRAPSAQMVALP
jgi:hypothetical protein